jgi:hypothetical protein
VRTSRSSIEHHKRGVHDDPMPNYPPKPQGPEREVVTSLGLDLYWIPLGAGQQVVRTSGRIYEGIVALGARRPRRDLYHSALVAMTAEGRVTIEMAPQPDDSGRSRRGVVAEGAVGSRWFGRWRVFRYEVRKWLDGEIPDLGYAVASPVRVTDDPQGVAEVLDLVALVPTPVWGRDELRLGEMWNSNSVVSWALTRAGLLDAAGELPFNGRAPGWDAGVAAARRASPAVLAPIGRVGMAGD